MRFGGFDLMIPFQFTFWDDPLKMFGLKGFEMSVDANREVAVFP